jgi:hypothetical protein
MTKIFILVVHTKLTFNLVYNDLKRLICTKPIYFQGGNRDSCRNKSKITKGWFGILIFKDIAQVFFFHLDFSYCMVYPFDFFERSGEPV